MPYEVTYPPATDLDDGDEIKDALLGWTIVSVGVTKEYVSKSTTQFIGKPPQSHEGYVEGGLTLILQKDGAQRKVILGYNELGEWLEYVGDCPDPTATSTRMR